MQPDKVDYGKMFRRYRKLVAGVYWLFTALVYVVGLYQQNNEGGIPSVIVTLPWSVLVLGTDALLDSTGLFRPLLGWLATTAGNFLMFPVICGGLNAALIYGVGSLTRRRRKP